MCIKNIIIATILFLISVSCRAEAVSCDRITSEKDDFKDEVTLRTPLLAAAQISKIKSKHKNPRYYLLLSTIGRTVVVDGKGAFILFEDEGKWSKSVRIDVDATENGFEYTAFIPLTNADMKLLKSKKISKFKLYIFEQYMSENDANMFIQDVNCIVNL